MFEKVYNKCYYRSFDVLEHNRYNDFWVILNRRVLNSSNLMRKIEETPNSDKSLAALHQLNMFGGTDISEYHLERQNNKLEMLDLRSMSEYGKQNNLFWWNDPTFIIGGITNRERHVCVKNKSTGNQFHLTVCEEDSIYMIQAKFFAMHPERDNDKPIWRKNESTCCPSGFLHLDKTLSENGLKFDPKDEVVFIWMFHKDEVNICSGFM